MTLLLLWAYHQRVCFILGALSQRHRLAHLLLWSSDAILYGYVSTAIHIYCCLSLMLYYCSTVLLLFNTVSIVNFSYI